MTPVDYAARGWSVFPCRDKQPLVKWRDESSSDPDKISRWWRAHADAQVAVDCGKSGLVVVDLDGPDAQREWERLEGELGLDALEIPAVRTGRGLHLYFKAVETEVRNSASQLAPGIDVRASGGYVIAPPSVHASGAVYEWISDGEPPPLPLSLLRLLTGQKDGPDRAAHARVLAKIVERASSAPDGRGREALVKEAYTAGGLTAFTEAEIVDALLGAIAGWAWRDPKDRTDAERVIRTQVAAGRRRPIDPQTGNGSAPSAQERGPEVDVVSLRALLARDIPEPETLVDHAVRILTGQRTLLHGPPSAFKTWVCLDSALRVAREKRVLYCLAEGGGRATRNRLAMLAGTLASTPMGAHALMEEASFTLALGGWGVLSQTGYKRWTDLLDEHRPDLVLMDPCIAYLGAGKDENSSADIAALLNVLDRAAGAGAAVILVHHDRKPQKGETMGDPRGSSAFRAWADVVVAATRPDIRKTSIDLTETKRRDDELTPARVVEIMINGTASLEVSAKDGNAARAQASELEGRVMQALGSGPKPRRVLRDMLSVRSEKLDRTLESMVALGTLNEFEVMIRGCPRMVMGIVSR